MLKHCLILAGIVLATGCEKKHQPTEADQNAARSAQAERRALEAAKIRDDKAAEKAKAKQEVATANLKAASERADDLSKQAGVEWKGPEATWARQWVAFVHGKDQTHEEGEWTFQREPDGAFAVWRKKQEVAGKTAGDIRDEALATDVKAKINSNEDLKKLAVKVSAQEHTVILRGDVGDENQAAEAVRLALSTPGTEKVVSNLNWAK